MKNIEIKHVSPEYYREILNLEVENSIKHTMAEFLNLESAGLTYLMVSDNTIEGYSVLLRSMNYWVFNIYELVVSDNVSTEELSNFVNLMLIEAKKLGCLELRYYVDDSNKNVTDALTNNGFAHNQDSDSISLYVKDIPIK